MLRRMATLMWLGCWWCSLCEAQTIRRMFLRAVMEEWDYLPGGWDYVGGVAAVNSSHAHALAQFAPPLRPGSRFLKLRYKRFVDAAMTQPYDDDGAATHLGLLGFLLHAEVGDTVVVTLRNDAPVAISLHAHGVRYNKSHEGIPGPQSEPQPPGSAVAAGESYTYEWQVPERAGPGPGEELSSVAWLVHSHVSEQADVTAGLVGALVVTRKGSADSDGAPLGVDHEFVLLWSILDEGRSRVARESMRWALAGRPRARRASLRRQSRGRAAHSDIAVPGFDAPLDPNDTATAALEAALADDNAHMLMRMHSVNGMVFGALPGLEMRVGERVRWYSVALGDEQDLHTPHWHGNTLLTAQGARVDTVSLLPGVSVTADMVPDTVGRFLVHCHVQHHMVMGMAAWYNVLEARAGGAKAAQGDVGNVVTLDDAVVTAQPFGLLSVVGIALAAMLGALVGRVSWCHSCVVHSGE